MRRYQRRLIAGLVLVACTAALGAIRLASSGVDMTAGAQTFVKTLSPEQTAQAVLPYDAPKRTDWHYIPKPSRKGLQIREMSEPQRAAAHALLKAALSAAGYGKATKIMQLEALLKELEKSKAGAPLRDPERYYFTLFGSPAAAGKWGLSVEGHHLSLNFVVENNQVVSSTPTFFGANPGVIMADYGPGFEKGTRVLKREEELAFQLLDSLTPKQRKVAIVAAKAPGDVRDAGKASPPISPAVGLAASDMNKEQALILRALIDEYIRNLPADVAEQRAARIESDGFGGIKFCWQGADKPGVGHDYRIQGRSFLIEFNNTQPDSAGNVANHIHSVWHDLAGNFAIPVEPQK